MSIHTIHGLCFEIDGDGFTHSENDRDLAESNLYEALKALTADDLSALHATLKNIDGDYPDLASRLCYDALRQVTANWHRPDHASLMLIAHD